MHINYITSYVFHRYLAFGDSFNMIAYSHRMGALYSSKSSESGVSCHLGLSADWLHACTIHREVEHVQSNSGSLYYNYKGTFSIILLVVVDANYLFRIISVGGYCRTSDCGSLYKLCLWWRHQRWHPGHPRRSLHPNIWTQLSNAVCLVCLCGRCLFLFDKIWCDLSQAHVALKIKGFLTITSATLSWEMPQASLAWTLVQVWAWIVGVNMHRDSDMGMNLGVSSGIN